MATVTGMTASAINSALDALVESGEFDVSGELILTLRGGGTVNAGSPSLTIPDSSTTVKGIVELATSAETETGTDTVRAITPASLAAALVALVPANLPDSSATVKGKVELATDAEAVTGTDTVRAITPANLSAVLSALTSSLITPKPLGVVARRTRTSNSSATTSATGLGVIKLSFACTSGRLYRIRSNVLKFTSTAGDEVAARVFSTIATGTPSDPTTSDTEVCTVPRTITNSGRYEDITVDDFIVAGTTGTCKVTLFVARLSGSGNAAIHATGVNMKFWVEDGGVPSADAGSGADA